MAFTSFRYNSVLHHIVVNYLATPESATTTGPPLITLALPFILINYRTLIAALLTGLIAVSAVVLVAILDLLGAVVVHIVAVAPFCQSTRVCVDPLVSSAD